MSHLLFLKVKIRSLESEAKIIRAYERKLLGGTELREQLVYHRRIDIRREARATHLAYGYLRGRAYRLLEATCHEPPHRSNVERMVKKYGGVGAVDGLATWFDTPLPGQSEIKAA